MVIDKYTAVVDGISLLELGDTHSYYTPSEVNTFLLLPIEHNKIRIYYEDTKPIGLITWCWLSTTKSNLFLNDKYQPTAEDYKQDTSDDLWGMEFIAPFGHTRKMMRSIRKTTTELYGTANQVHFRRFYNRNKLHKRMF